jgi:hypothetical protein
MKITINTENDGGSLVVYIIDNKEKTILTLKNTDSSTCDLVYGEKYSLEWHVFGADKAEYKIKASVMPQNVGFPEFNMHRKYPDAHEDGSVFSFNLQNPLI